MLLHPIQYKEGIIWVDAKAMPKENQKLFCLEDILWGKKGEWCTFLSTSEYKCRVLGNNGHEYLAQCSIFYALGRGSVCIPVAQTGLNLPDIPYLEIDITPDYARHFPSIFSVWIDGYKEASTKKYTEEDVRKIITKVAYDLKTNGYGGCSVASHYADEWIKDNKEFIQSLQSKPLSVEIDMYNGNTDEFCQYWKDGKPFIKVIKVNYETDSSSK